MKHRLKLAKNQANAKQHPEAELLLFENYTYSSPKPIGHVLKKKQKNKCACVRKINLIEKEDENQKSIT